MEPFELHLKQLSKEITTDEQKERLREAMKVYQGDDKLESSHDIEKRLREGDPIPVMATGIESLDTLLRGGVRPGQLIVIGAQAKSGKTEFCIFLTNKMQERKPLWFSYEDGAEELVERFMDRSVTVPLFYTPSALKHRSVEWIEERIVESIVKYGTELVFIDNLQSAVPRGMSQEQEYTFFVRGLKDIAEKWNVPIILVHHVVKSDMERAPDVNDLKGASSIAQFANTVIMLWRQTARADNQIVITENVAVSVQAVRRGKPGTVRMTFDGTTFYENNWNSDIEAFNNHGKF
jgi:replicative DNA helicase